MTHPRQMIREDIIATLKARPFFVEKKIPVYDSYVRDYAKGLTRFVSVFTPSEYLSRPVENSESRPGMPVSRNITIAILALVQREGEGTEAATDADDLAREIEIALNEAFPMIVPQTASITFSAEKETSCLIEMIFSVQYTDTMGR